MREHPSVKDDIKHERSLVYSFMTWWPGDDLSSYHASCKVVTLFNINSLTQYHQVATKPEVNELKAYDT